MAEDTSGSGLSWLGYVGYALGATVLGGTVFAGTRRAQRVAAARSRLSTLLNSAAGSDARVVITGATSGVGEELSSVDWTFPGLCPNGLHWTPHDMRLTAVFQPGLVRRFDVRCQLQAHFAIDDRLQAELVFAFEDEVRHVCVYAHANVAAVQ